MHVHVRERGREGERERNGYTREFYARILLPIQLKTHFCFQENMPLHGRHFSKPTSTVRTCTCTCTCMLQV